MFSTESLKRIFSLPVKVVFWVTIGSFPAFIFLVLPVITFDNHEWRLFYFFFFSLIPALITGFISYKKRKDVRIQSHFLRIAAAAVMGFWLFGNFIGIVNFSGSDLLYSFYNGIILLAEKFMLYILLGTWWVVLVVALLYAALVETYRYSKERRLNIKHNIPFLVIALLTFSVIVFIGNTGMGDYLGDLLEYISSGKVVGGELDSVIEFVISNQYLHLIAGLILGGSVFSYATSILITSVFRKKTKQTPSKATVSSIVKPATSGGRERNPESKQKATEDPINPYGLVAMIFSILGMPLFFSISFYLSAFFAVVALAFSITAVLKRRREKFSGRIMTNSAFALSIVDCLFFTLFFYLKL